MAKCKYCEAPIFWKKESSGRFTPCEDPQLTTPHRCQDGPPPTPRVTDPEPDITPPRIVATLDLIIEEIRAAATRSDIRFGQLDAAIKRIERKLNGDIDL